MSSDFRLAGVVGHPVSHSLSPLLHTFWLKQHGIDGAYVPLSAVPEHFSGMVGSVHRAGFRGLNVTAPHKESAHALAHVLHDSAHITGAANLLLFSEGRIEARNTDVVGLRESLAEEFGADVVRSTAAVLLGAGGAARAAVVALDALGANEIRVLGRNRVRTENVVADLGGYVNASVIAVGWDQWTGAAADAALLVNATAGGPYGSERLQVSLEPLPATAAVYDLVYNPLETELLKEARNTGHRAANGLGMLVRQAAPAFEAFYGVRPENLPAARTELEKALSR
jgi:shikimate dehydrogenase